MTSVLDVNAQCVGIYDNPVDLNAKSMDGKCASTKLKKMIV